ncbi:MAG: hypothetical protein M1838_002599 [Thelocarpon superellum]|nr:MAG: hypothetical protein M1838_002599 [Thelocarpon superellum]
MSSLFGSLGGASSAAAAPPQTSTATAANPLAASSLFGAPAASQPNNQTQAQAAPTSQAQQNAQSAPSSHAPAGNSQSAYFDSLLERSRKRKNGKDSGVDLGDLPSLQLGLGDIAQRVRQLGGSHASPVPGNGVDSKAHYLLAASGISPGSALRDLDKLDAGSANAAVLAQPPAFDADNAAYVSNLQSQSTLALIEEGLSRAARDFDRYLEQNVTMEWDAQRRRIYEHFGLTAKVGDGDGRDARSSAFGLTESGSFGRSRRGQGNKASSSRAGTPSKASVSGMSSLQRSVIGTPARSGVNQTSLFADVAEKATGAPQAGVDDRFLRDKQAKFADQVQLLNESRLQGKVYPILREFGSVERQAGGDQTSQLVDAYRALIEIVREDPSAKAVSDPNASRERQFAGDYLLDENQSRKTVAMNRRILDGSRRFLEKSFFQSLEATVARNPREARLGGVPTTLNKVRAYVTLRAAKRDLAPENTDLQSLGMEYCWVIIFFLLRSGFLRDAVEYVKENATAFRVIDRNFPTYIANYYKNESRRLDDNLQDRINAEYNQRTRIAPENSIDPYRMACYKIIGRCDLNKRSLDLVGQGIEDWIWLQFSLAREAQRLDEPAGESFGATEVRAVIREIGQRYFVKGAADAPGGYGTYFLLQILGGMFEQAIAYLYSFSYVSAVHFAIALDFYGLLRVSDFTASESELLTFTTRDMPQVNFGRMLGYYTRDFRAAKVEAATDYLTLICLNGDLPGAAGQSQTSLCHEALRELVLETREFAKLLGDLRPDGTRIKGAIELRLQLIKPADPDDFLRTITMQAASVAEDNGRTTDAVLLYHLAEEYDNVISIINRALSEAISVDVGQEPVTLQPLKSRAPPSAAATGTSSATPTPPEPASAPKETSLSLTSVDDAATLARNMIGLYNSKAMYFSKIKQMNRDACGVLLRMSEAKQHVEQGRWAEALDIIDSLSILPLRAGGQIYLIRNSAQAFTQLPPTVARNIGNLLMWTITCCGRQRDVLRSSAFEDPTKERMKEELAGKARDLMVYAGLVRLRLPPRVFEVIARAGQEVESW